MLKPDDHPLSIRAAARLLGVARERISDAVKSGELPNYRLGRRRLLIYRRDLESWVRSHPGRPSEPLAAIRAARERVLDAIESIGSMRGPVAEGQRELSRLLDSLDDAIAEIAARGRQ